MRIFKVGVPVISYRTHKPVCMGHENSLTGQINSNPGVDSHINYSLSGGA